MIELVSINVTNFRAFSEGEFAPLGVGQGMTSINGRTGLGKSSLVHALVWSLFGVTPVDVPVRALRRQGSEGDVKADVVFRHDGQTVEVTRSLSGRNDTTTAKISLDGVEQTNISAKTATAWVVARLGLDAEAFLTAFVVRQKELDSLIDARPAQRRKTIERLAGIERMSSAIDLARTDARAAGRLLDALPAREDPEIALAAQSAAEAAALAAMDATFQAGEEAEDLQLTSDDASASARAGREHAEAASAAATQVALASQKLDAATDRAARLRLAAVGAEGLLAAESAVEGARAARSNAERFLASVESVVAQSVNAAGRLEVAEKDFARADRAFQSAGRVLESARGAAEAPTDLDDQIRDQQDAVEAAGLSRGSARGEWTRLRKAIDTLTVSDGAGSADCPTCAHPLEDPAALVASLGRLLAEVGQQGSEFSGAFDKATAKVARLQQAKSNFAAAATSLIAAENAAADASAAVERAQETVDGFAADAVVQSEAAELAQQNATDAFAGLPALIAAEEAAHAALRDVAGAVKAAGELTIAEASESGAVTVLAAATEMQALATELVGTVDFRILESQAQDAAVASRVASEAAATARTVSALADRDRTSAQRAYESALAAAQARFSALADVERTQAIAAALEEFRRDRLARLAPELSEVASDFVARTTNGRFTALELDEEFTPILTEANGQQRPVYWLSGGEVSAVALALRVAIGEVLAGQRGGLLILDEVLTAQDPERRQAAVAAIRALPRQVIMINHLSEEADLVDLIADVVDDGDGGSTVVTHTPDTVSGSLSDAEVDA